MTTSLIEPLSEEEIKAAAEAQLHRAVTIQKIHVSTVRPDDTVFHEGKVRTVCAKDIKRSKGIGTTLFGDSYVLGRKPVQRIIMQRALPETAV